MTDAVVENMMAGYTFVDTMIADEVNLFEVKNLVGLLELNHLVLCGDDPTLRLEYHKHIEATRQRFYGQEPYNIDNIVRWYHKHEHESPWKQAAGIYVRILSHPQLYIEGNHRTGALIMSYILAQNGKAPFVLTVKNAKAYFDPSTLIKQTEKTTSNLLMKLPHMKKRFARFLEQQANAAYLGKAA